MNPDNFHGENSPPYTRMDAEDANNQLINHGVDEHKEGSRPVILQPVPVTALANGSGLNSHQTVATPNQSVSHVHFHANDEEEVENEHMEENQQLSPKDAVDMPFQYAVSPIRTPTKFQHSYAYTAGFLPSFLPSLANLSCSLLCYVFILVLFSLVFLCSSCHDCVHQFSFGW